MRELILQLFGEYEPVTTISTTTVGDLEIPVETVAEGLAGVDWPWIAGVVLFGIVLYMVLSIVRSVISNV